MLLIILIKLEGEYAGGQFALLIAVTTPVFMLLNLQLRVILGTDSNGEIEYGTYLTVRICTSLLAIIIILFVASMQGYDPIFLFMFIAWSLGKAFESLSDLGYGLLQKKGQMDLIGISQLIKAVLFVLLFWFILYISGSMLFGILGLTIVWVIVYLLFDLRYFSKVAVNRPILQLGKIWRLVKLGIPMGVVMGIISFNANVPRYILENYLDVLFVGYFSSVYYLKIVGSTFINALGQSSVSKLAILFATSEIRGFVRKLISLIIIGIFIGIIGLVIAFWKGPQLLILLYNEQYGQFGTLFILIMTAGGLEYIASLLGYGITATRNFKIQPYIFIVVLITATISCYLLIPEYGLNGAGYAVLISSFFQLILSLTVMSFILLKAKHPGESV